MLYPSASGYSDLCLFNRFKEHNDISAFNELYRRYQAPLLEIACNHLQCKQKAEDIIQDIFTAFYQRRQLVTIEVSVKAYLLRALKYKLINDIRNRRVRNKHKQYVLDIHTYRVDFLSIPEEKDLADAVQHALNSLPDKCREVFLLSRYQEYSHKAISARLNISLSTVEKHMVKALRVMRSCLNEYQNRQQVSCL